MMAMTTSCSGHRRRRRQAASVFIVINATNCNRLFINASLLLILLLLFLSSCINKVNTGMINCEGRVFSVEDEMIHYIMCCGKQLFDARISRCRKAQSSSNSHRHFHEPESLPSVTSNNQMNNNGEIEGEEEGDVVADNNEDTQNNINKNNIVYDEIARRTTLPRGEIVKTTTSSLLPIGSPKKPFCTEEGTLIWTSIDLREKTNDPLSFFPIGSLSCCGRRLYRKSAFFCCGEILYPKTSRGQLCCGGIYYPITMAPQYLTCCNNTLVDIRARPQCAREIEKNKDGEYDNDYYSLDYYRRRHRIAGDGSSATTAAITTEKATTPAKTEKQMWYQIGHDYR